MNFITEKSFQLSFANSLESQNWKQLKGDELFDERESYKDIVLKKIFKNKILKLNPNLDENDFSLLWIELQKKLKNNISLIKKNIDFDYILKYGLRLNISPTNKPLIKLIDLDNFQNNDFHFVEEFTVLENKKKRRADLVLFINGLPLIIIELKSLSNENASAESAAKQIENYIQEVPKLFAFNLLNVISDGKEYLYSALNLSKNLFWNKWKRKNIEDDTFIANDQKPLELQQTFIKGLLNPNTICNLLKDFSFFNNEDKKILPRYHQYYATLKAFHNIQNKEDKRMGIICHTQGSGKSMTMLFLSHLIQAYTNKTVLFITDRNNLDNQLAKKFKNAQNSPEKAYIFSEIKQFNRQKDLERELLKIKHNGVYFSTIQKFNKDTNLINNRKNIIIIADEAHRSQYGGDADIYWNKEKSIFEEKYGYAKYLNLAFPNAKVLGFTATPIDLKDRSTKNIFGEIIDYYTMRESISDRITVPLNYQEIIIPLKLDQERNLEELIETKRQTLSEPEFNSWRKYKSKKTNISSIYSNQERINKVAQIFKSHYNLRKNQLYGKALFVAYDRKIALKLFQRLNEYQDLNGKIALIVTSSHKDSFEMRNIIGEKQEIVERIHNFKDKNSQTKIAIVVDKLLTGFDMPELDVMYIDKKMHSHNLYQAIARVNRSFLNKDKGLIVSFAPLKGLIQEAIAKFDNGKKESKYAVISTKEESINKVISLVKNLEAIFPLSYLEKLFSEVTNNFSSNDWVEKFLTLNKFEQFNQIRQVYERLLELNDKKQDKNEDKNKDKEINKDLMIGHKKIIKDVFLVNVNELIIEYRYLNFEIEKTPLLKTKIHFFMSLKLMNHKLTSDESYFAKQAWKNEGENDWEKQLDKSIILNEEQITFQKKDEIEIFNIDTITKERNFLKEQFKNHPKALNVCLRNLTINKIKKSKFLFPKTHKILLEKVKNLLDKYNRNIINDSEFNYGLEETLNILSKKTLQIKDSGLKMEAIHFYDILFSENYDKDQVIQISNAILTLKEKMDANFFEWDKKQNNKSKFLEEVKKIFINKDYPTKITTEEQYISENLEKKINTKREAILQEIIQNK